MSVYGVAGSSTFNPVVPKRQIQSEAVAGSSQQAPVTTPNTSASSIEDQLQNQVLPLLVQTIVTLLTQFLNQHQQPPVTPPTIPGTGSNVISGAQGPFDLTIPGAFGANAALNQQQLALTNPLLEANSSVRYSPEGQPKVNDAFGFAAEDIRRLDVNGDGAVDLSELTASIGNAGLAQQYFSVLDRNKDNKIDTVEAASLLLAQDGANSLFAGIVNPVVDPGASANADGLVTPQELALTNQAITSAPSLAGETLDQLQSTLDLQNRFNQFKDNLPKLVPSAASPSTIIPDFSSLPDFSPRFVLPKTIDKRFLDRFKDLFNLINGTLKRS